MVIMHDELQAQHPDASAQVRLRHHSSARDFLSETSLPPAPETVRCQRCQCLGTDKAGTRLTVTASSKEEGPHL